MDFLKVQIAKHITFCRLPEPKEGKLSISSFPGSSLAIAVVSRERAGVLKAADACASIL